MRLFFLIYLMSAVSLATTFKEKHFDPFAARLIDRTSLTILLAGGATVAAVNPHDDSIREDWKAHQKMSSSQASVGDYIGTGGLGVLITAGQYLWDENPNHYQSHVRALTYSTLATYALKYSFGRRRPGGSQSPHSFPSGHTSTIFATATAMTYTYGWKGALVTYPIAIFVGLSRLADDAHWASDLVGGAVVGFLTARASTYDFDENSATSTAMMVYPVFHNDSLGAGLYVSF